MAPPRTASSEGVVLIPETLKNSTTGYKNVSYSRRSKKFVAEVQGAGKRVHLGSFDTAEEAATAYARSAGENPSWAHGPPKDEVVSRARS
ncbi:hypothetical protein EMIHUDRAFT_208489 [Emiliania huxleyi CCMP1516]|uniref:AP2/ERF domain-containing protein n=2 Tax=Emiliania huxleyi TaxID=2903 RepID=A0A0D3JAM6_EMIH1|nr:hypothetical protein EMIHUDRAFT_208489 [Emiliania huxleyi CCMP1516]EOD20561.1 hypothetical protein EMIHUDRAFT_208489 [Emiliania huxleyi CCMP1516]|eukprot:XP_005772990.1 hypothetical protein EMIHUDRAFT_208489 [Emiliania huxleyi CCMP1516]